MKIDGVQLVSGGIYAIYIGEGESDGVYVVRIDPDNGVLDGQDGGKGYPQSGLGNT